MPKRHIRIVNEFNRSAPPPAPRDGTVDSYHGRPIPDPFRPLEDLAAPETKAWVTAQNAYLRAFLKGRPSKAHTEKFLRRWWGEPQDRELGKYGRHYFKMRTPDLAHHESLLVRKRAKGLSRVLLDPYDLAPDGSLAIDQIYPSPDGKLVACILTQGGGDTVSLYILDVRSGLTVDRIDNLRYTDIAWDEDENNEPNFTYLAPGRNDLHNLVRKRHRVGDDAANDELIFGQNKADAYPILRDLGDDREWLLLKTGIATKSTLWMRPQDDQASFRRIFNIAAYFNLIKEHNGKIVMITDHGAPRRRLVAFDPRHPAPSQWKTLIPEQPFPAVMKGATFEKNRIFATFSGVAGQAVKIYTAKGRHLQDIALPPHNDCHLTGRNRKGEMRLRLSGFQQKNAVYAYDEKRRRLRLSRCGIKEKELKDCIVETIAATSPDGMEIPITVIRRRDTLCDGTAALQLHAYAGFGEWLDMAPNQDIVTWIHAGGIYAQACLRGGGELGKNWHERGRGQHKQNSFDDLAACARYLAAQKYTSPQRLVISGASNGGLVMLATMLQQPHLFGAVIAHVPVTDMLRFHKHAFGSYWKAEYGDIDGSSRDFEAVRRYSPLHNVRRKALYPPTLVLTGDHDDRVVPSHAYKFVAAMQKNAHPDNLCFLYTEKNAGHNGPLTTARIIRQQATIHAFIEKTIGPVDQEKYRRTPTADQARSWGPKPAQHLQPDN